MRVRFCNRPKLIFPLWSWARLFSGFVLGRSRFFLTEVMCLEFTTWHAVVLIKLYTSLIIHFFAAGPYFIISSDWICDIEMPLNVYRYFAVSRRDAHKLDWDKRMVVVKNCLRNIILVVISVMSETDEPWQLHFFDSTFLCFLLGSLGLGLNKL